MSRSGPNQSAELRGVAARDALEFRLGELSGSQITPPLAPPKGMFDHRALPGHPCGEGAHLVERNVGRKTDAALAGAAHRGVQNAVAGKDLELAVIERHGNVDGDFPFGILHVAVDALLEIQLLGGDFEAGFGGFVDVQFVLHGNRSFYRHAIPPQAHFSGWRAASRRAHLAPFRKSRPVISPGSATPRTPSIVGAISRSEPPGAQLQRDHPPSRE